MTKRIYALLLPPPRDTATIERIITRRRIPPITIATVESMPKIVVLSPPDELEGAGDA
jgi:hypothetical protein